MKIGLIGLGKMGINLAHNMINHGHEIIGHDLNKQPMQDLLKIGGSAVNDLNDMCEKLDQRKVIWLMVPAGDVIDQILQDLITMLNTGDIIIDGGNSNYKNSIRRHQELKSHQIHFMDCGTSGGLSGALSGACLMIGGDEEPIRFCEPLFRDISADGGYLHTGEIGSGHFLKMVHNGIEYGIMQSISEGFEIIEKSKFKIKLSDIAKVWNNGSVIRSWLLELAGNVFTEDPQLNKIKGVVQSSGEGKWVAETALELEVPTPVITLSLLMRYRSQQSETFSGKLLAALRNKFGGHDINT